MNTKLFKVITAFVLCLAMVLPYCGNLPVFAEETALPAPEPLAEPSAGQSEPVQTPEDWKFYKLVTAEANFSAGKKYVIANTNQAKEAKVLTFTNDGGFYRLNEASSVVLTTSSPSGTFLVVQDDSWVWETKTNTLELSLYHNTSQKYLSANYQSQLLLRDTPSEQYGFRITSSGNLAGPHQYATPDGATSSKNWEVIYRDGLFRMYPRSSTANKAMFVYAYQEDTSIQSLSAYIDTTTGQCSVGSTDTVLTGSNIVLTLLRSDGTTSTQTVPMTVGMLGNLSLGDRYVPDTYTCSVSWCGMELCDDYQLTVTSNEQIPSSATRPVVLSENNHFTFREANHLKDSIEYVFVHNPEGSKGYAPFAQAKDGKMTISAGEGPIFRIPGEADNYFIAQDARWIWTYITRPGNSAIHDMGNMVYNGGMSMKEDYELLFWTREEGPYSDIGWRKGTNYNHIGFGTSKSAIYASLRYENGRIHGVNRNLQSSLSNVAVIYEKVDVASVVTYLDLNSGAIETDASGSVQTGGNIVVHKVAADGTDTLTTMPITLNMISGLTLAQQHIPGVYECQVISNGVVLSENYSLTILGDPVENMINWDGYGSSVGGVAWPLNELVGQVPEGSGGQISTGCKLAVYTHKTNDEVIYQEVDVTLGMLNVTADQLKEAGTITGLTLTYKGQVVTDNFTLHVTETIQNDYPDFPNAGSVRVDKQMDTTKYNYLETGSAQIDLSVTGIPITNKANVVIILDASSSMNQCTHGVGLDANVTAEQKEISNRVMTAGGMSVDGDKEALAAFTFPNMANKATYLAILNRWYAGEGLPAADRKTMQTAFSAYGYCRYGEKWVGTDENSCQQRSHITKQALAELLEYLKQDIHGYSMDIDVAVAYFNQYYVIDEDIRLLTAGENPVKLRSDKELMQAFANAKDVDIPTVLSKYSTVTGTNYDRGMEWAYQLLSQKQTDDYNEYLQSGSTAAYEPRQDFVLFMSDGAPYQFNYMADGTGNIWYDYYDGKLSNDLSQYVAPEILPIFKELYNPDGKLWLAEAIKGSKTQKYKVIDPSMAKTNYVNYVSGLGATMMTVTLNSYAPVMARIASSADYYIPTETAHDIQQAFSVFGSLVSTGSGAVFEDQMGPEFDLQMSNSLTVKLDDGTVQNVPFDPSITVQTYELYKYSEYLTAGSGITMDMVGKRKDLPPTVIEKITFSDDGKSAYSTLIDGGKTNILINGVICAKNFRYNTDTAKTVKIDTNADGTPDKDLAPETFFWTIDAIPEDEMVLTYNVYLTGTLEGMRAEGSYPTNEYATLYYTNHLGHECHLDTTSPMLPWNQAVVGYAFYLVDAEGNPIVNEDQHITGSFEKAIRMTQPQYIDLLYNSDENVTPWVLNAADVLPAGYSLYDPTAAYHVALYADGRGSWQITGNASKPTTYITGYGGVPTTDSEATAGMDTEGHSYDYPAYATSSTVVWFAVRADVNAVPDTIVIDYGISVDIHVLGNDVVITDQNAVIAGIGKTCPADLDGNGVIFTDTLTDGFTSTFTGTFGTAAVRGNVVRYTPSTLLMTAEDTFAYCAGYQGEKNSGFYYSTVTIIPATNLYFEDTFITFDDEWAQVGQSITGAVQDEDRVGSFHLPQIDANDVYGYDSAYTDMQTWSMGSAMKATVDSGDHPEAIAEFTFTGTGFDVISYTDSDTGILMLSVVGISDPNYNSLLVVDSYYQSSDGLYQVPIMKIKDLPYGTYWVELYVGYGKSFDHAGNGSYNFYLDAVRIYDPANDGDNSSVISNAYQSDKEGWPSYQELRNLLITMNTFDSLGQDDVVDGVIFIDGNPALGEASIADYVSFGPNNELYLAPGQAIAFELNMNAPDDNLAGIHLGLKSVGGTAAAKVYSAAVNHATVKERRLSSATQQYYDISQLDGHTVVIWNVGGEGDAILSVTDLKTTYKNPPKNTGRLTVNRSSAHQVLASMTTVQAQPIPVLKPQYPSLSFESEVVYNVYFAVENPVEPENMGLAIFDSTGEQLLSRIPGATQAAELYTVHTNGIPAKMLGDEVFFKIYADLPDGTTVYSKLYSYSAVTYAQNILQGAGNKTQKALVAAMMNYGAAAQEYFGYRTDSLMNGWMSDEQKALCGSYSKDLVSPAISPDNSKLGEGLTSTVGAFSAKLPTLTFGDRFSINYYFTPAKVVDGNMSLYYWDQSVYEAGQLTLDNATVATMELQADGSYLASGSPIAARELDDTVFAMGVYTSEGITMRTGILPYSVAQYCLVNAVGSNAQTKLAEATVVYGSLAAEYFAET